MLGALCYVCVPNIDELTISRYQLKLGEFAPGLEPLEFVSGECSSRSARVMSICDTIERVRFNPSNAQRPLSSKAQDCKNL